MWLVNTPLWRRAVSDMRRIVFVMKADAVYTKVGTAKIRQRYFIILPITHSTIPGSDWYSFTIGIIVQGTITSRLRVQKPL